MNQDTVGPLRCRWSERTDWERDYHDLEWGTPVHEDRTLFEFLLLEGAQAGLSWVTILKKRAAYRKAFKDFEPERVAAFGDAQVDALMQDPGIIRNRLKIQSAIKNARAFLKVMEEFGSFNRYVWRFVDGEPLLGRWLDDAAVPVKSPESEALSLDLAQRGFGFCGPVICYSYMQAIGMVNDHTQRCFRFPKLEHKLDADNEEQCCQNRS